VNPDTPNVLQAMMKLEQTKARAKTANKVALETEKENDAVEKAVEELKRQLQPKRARTDDDAGDAHDLITEFDNCDLSDHLREGTRVQNRRNVQVGSRDNQQKPRTGKDGFLHHIVNSSELRVTDFPLAKVRPLHLDAVDRGGRRTRRAAVRKLQGVGNSTFVLSVENDNDFRSRCE
jgi:hypothetical protein